MEKINIAELLKDCPKGMELDCTMFDDVVFDHISIEPNTHPIFIKIKNYDYTIQLTEYGQYMDIENAKCVIFPKGKTTWEGFVPHCKFKDGDIVFTRTGGNNLVSIFKQFSRDVCRTYIDLCIDDNDWFIDTRCLCSIEEITTQRLATEEEKAKLFKAIKDNGYKWNEETKALEKLIEPKFKIGDRVRNKNYKDYIYDINDIIDKGYRAKEIDADSPILILFGSQEDNYELVPDKFDINTLVPFESKVLVRNSNSGFWQPTFWGIYESEKTNEHQYRNYLTTKGFFRHCIPYNDDTKHLLGTTNDCDEYFKTWE